VYNLDAPANMHSKMTDGRLSKCRITRRRSTLCRSATIKALFAMPATVLTQTTTWSDIIAN